MSEPSPHPCVVTVSALYGAGGSLIGQRVADALGVPFFDRAIDTAVAARTGLAEAVVDDVDAEPRSALQRALAAIGRAPTMAGEVGGSIERLDVEEGALRAHIEEFRAANNLTFSLVSAFLLIY